MIQLDIGDHRPLYEQIRDKLKELIIAGLLSENDKIPSVREMAGILAINPNTIQKAYRELESEGYIYSVPGKGSFASGDTGAEERRKQELLEQLLELAAELNDLGVSGEELAALVRKEKPVERVTEVLGAPQRETVKEEPK